MSDSIEISSLGLVARISHRPTHWSLSHRESLFGPFNNTQKTHAVNTFCISLPPIENMLHDTWSNMLAWLRPGLVSVMGMVAWTLRYSIILITRTRADLASPLHLIRVMESLDNSNYFDRPLLVRVIGIILYIWLKKYLVCLLHQLVLQKSSWLVGSKYLTMIYWMV